VGAFFVLLFLPADNDNLGLDLPVGVGRCSAVTSPATDLDVFVKLELWLGHLISSLAPNTGFCEALRRRNLFAENLCSAYTLFFFH
jgi:hypothetical protein